MAEWILNTVIVIFLVAILFAQRKTDKSIRLRYGRVRIKAPDIQEAIQLIEIARRAFGPEPVDETHD